MSRLILTVDDSASMRQLLQITLLEAGYQVTQANDGIDALARAQLAVFDLVITDINMPRMDGIALVHEIRTLPGYKFTPIVILTTESSRECKAAVKQAGATGWLEKPFDPDQLISAIGRLI